MAENVYEGMFILDSTQYGRDPGGVSGQIAKMLEEVGGSVTVSRLWEERRLAFPINGHRKGTYWLTYFRLDSKHLPAIKRKCELSETIVRSLFLKVDPRIVDALVEHATAARPQSSESEAKKPADDAPDDDSDTPVEVGVEDDSDD